MLITVPEFKEFIGPLVFLAGPIQGAEDWHSKAIKILSNTHPTVNIASPRGDYCEKKFDYNTQVDWESHYLALAAKSGGIIFWLAKEHKHSCDRAYAQTTRFELSEWITKYTVSRNIGPFVKVEKIKVFVGIEEGFTGAKYIRRRMSQDCPEITIHTTLEDLCREVSAGLR